MKPDAKTGEMLIGRYRVSPQDAEFRKMLAFLGWKVEPIYKASRPRLVRATTD